MAASNLEARPIREKLGRGLVAAMWADTAVKGVLSDLIGEFVHTTTFGEFDSDEAAVCSL